MRRHGRTYQASKTQVRNRGKRNTARALVAKRVGKAALRGKHIDHKRPLIKGGSNARSNLRVVSARANLKKGSK